jgi:4-carboxymuconolactone decarboxylase
LARKGFGDFMPKLAELTDEVVFGDIWERPGLSKRDRSVIVVTALIALNRSTELNFHLNKALENGVTKDELKEIITHLAFYCGWPSAMGAMGVAMEVFGKSK